MGLSIGMAFGMFGIVLILEILTAMLFRSQGSALNGVNLTIESGGHLWIWIPAVAVIPAFLEEFVFRGIVLGIYEKHMRPLWAVILSGIVFGLMHMQFSLFYLYIGIGVILGWIAYRSRSVWAGVVFHLVYNSLAVLISYFQTAYPAFFDSQLGLSPLMDGRMHPAFGVWIGFAALSAAVFILCLLAFNRSTKGRTAPQTNYPPSPLRGLGPPGHHIGRTGLAGRFLPARLIPPALHNLI